MSVQAITRLLLLKSSSFLSAVALHHVRGFIRVTPKHLDWGGVSGGSDEDYGGVKMDSE